MNRIVRGSAVLASAALLTLTACSTGVKDEEGWNKVLERDYDCAELVDVARDLPEKVDRAQVNEDLRARGCEPLPAR